MELFSIGHSTRKLEDLIAVLKHYGIVQLADVRHFPTSRHNPQFNRENLENELPKHGIGYFWLEKLGGFRTGGYEKYMRTKAYREGIKELLALAKGAPTAFMCAELLWFKCHRRHISDTLVRRRHKVVHIYDEKRTQEHKLRERMRKIRCD
ncbi:MAG: DUF488 domain-containing protein [Candidatus Aenigmatarchaeota archaeon]